MPLEPADFTRLYRSYAAQLLRFFARRTLQSEVAVDLVAETFARAFADRASFRGGSDSEAIAWIFGVARHQLSEYYRRGSVERRALARLGVEVGQMSELDYERVEELASLRSQRASIAVALAALSADQRRALELRVVQERPYDEVAIVLGVSEQTARARVSRALRALAQGADQEEGSELA
jgi:RNA polymerase sigma-70 factor (ECF subfamily)